MLVVVLLVRVRVSLAFALLLLQKLFMADGREGGSLMNDRSLVNLFVDRDGLMDSRGLNGLSLDNRLDCEKSDVFSHTRPRTRTGLVDVVVCVFLFKLSEVGAGPFGFARGAVVLVLVPHLVKLGLVLGDHLLLVLAHDGGGDTLGVLGRKSLVVLDRLDSVLRDGQ